MAEALPLRVKNRRSCSRVKTFHMFSDRVTSSSNSYAADVPSHHPSPYSEHVAINTFFFLRELCRGEWLLSAIISCFGRKKLKQPDVR
jgi:hypothetical protein